MRVLVLGGGGPIGQASVARLRAAGATVFWASRGPPAFPDEGHLIADRTRPQEIAEMVERLGLDTLIDCVAYTQAQTAPLLAALERRLGRYVLVSSCDVYRYYALLHRQETGRPELGELDEAAPLRASRLPYRGDQPRPADAPDRWMDDYDKIPIEEAVRGLACDWTILRLPMVYGPGDRQRRFRWALAPMLAGAPALQAPGAWLDWATTYGFIDNVGEAIALAARHPRAARSLFNVADETAMPHRAWVQRFAAATGWRGELQVTDDPEYPFVRAVELGYRPPVSPERAAELTLTA